MKRIAGLIMLIALWAVSPAQGGDFQINIQFQASTGDTDFDSFLKHVNIAAGDRLTGFVSDLTSSYHISAEDVNFMIYNEKMQPADALMILQLVKISGKPFKEVIGQFKKHREKGWGAIALSCGIKPGSNTFILLKQDIPSVIWKYEEIETTKDKKGSKHKKGSKGKGSKGKKGSKGSKGKKGSKKH